MNRVTPNKTARAASVVLTLIGMLCVASAFALNMADMSPPCSFNLDDPSQRQAFVESIRQRRQAGIQRAEEYLRRTGRPKRWTDNGRVFELMAIEDGQPIVYMTLNANSAISIAADIVRDDPYYGITGNGITIGVWDEGHARTTHQELAGRVIVKDTAAALSWHSTMVSGTAAATGIDPLAGGMAPLSLIWAYEWTNDDSEMATVAMSSGGQAGKIQLSNHSYGITCGWQQISGTWYWYGNAAYPESALFGQYNYIPRGYDEVCFDAQYYLPFMGAGNDRGDGRPSAGTTYYINGTTAAVFDGSTPYADNWRDGGFDTLMPSACAKNVLTIGAVNDAVTGGMRDVSKATMSSLSSWGPTDDGRIKPDLVTNGIGVYSCSNSGDAAYSNASGTSLAAPAAAGAAAQLLELHGRLFPGQYLRSSTLKALLIHTADDLGNPGPDYKFGWGLLNTEAAAEKLLLHKRNPTLLNIKEDYLRKKFSPNQSILRRDYTFVWDGVSPIKATLCWTDAEGSEENTNTLNSTAIKLVRNLGIIITAPDDSQYYPFVLDPANPNAPATTGNNTRDNVKQVLIAAPALQGTYNIQISFDSGANIDQQYYSLILSGQAQPAVFDLDGDGQIGLGDLTLLAQYWLTDAVADIYPALGDGIVNLLDLAEISRAWQE